MIIGQTIFAENGTPRAYFTPWFPRVSDNGVFAYEFVHNLGGSLAATVYHKDREDPGSSPGSPSGSFAQLGGTDFYQANCTALKELVRFKFTLTSANGSTALALFRVLTPTWYATARV